MTAGQGIDGAQPVRILLGYGVDHHGREVELLLETAALVWMLAGPSPTDQTHAPEITVSDLGTGHAVDEVNLLKFNHNKDISD